MGTCTNTDAKVNNGVDSGAKKNAAMMSNLCSVAAPLQGAALKIDM